MGINLATKYAKELDQVFTHGSYTDQFVNKKYDFDGVKTINVYTVTTVPLSDYARNDKGDRYGGNNEVEDVVTPYTLTKDRSFKLVIDRGNLEQGARAKQAAAVLKAQMNEQVIPEIDADRLATAAKGATDVSQAITAGADAYTDVLAAEAYLDEAKAPVSGRVLYVTPAYYNLIKKQIVTTMFASEYNDKLIGKGFVGELDGIPVVKVPTSYFPEKTNAVLYHKDALLGARQITNVRTKTDSELVDGTILLGRFIYGSFVLSGKKNAVASIVSAASASGSTTGSSTKS